MNGRFAVRVLLALVCAATLTEAGRSQPAAAAPRVKMTLRALATPVSGPTFENASTDVSLGIGDTRTTFFSAATDLCSVMTGDGTPMSGQPHAWTVGFTLVNVQIDKMTVDVAMERRDHEPPAVRREVRHLVISEGAPHVLDFVETDRMADCATRSIVLEVSAAFEEAPAFARELLSYDVWLTHRDAAGREWTRHEGRSARQGELSEFRFRPVSWPLDAVVQDGDHAVSISELVWGAVRGRIREDGRIDVSFRVSRDMAMGNGSTGDRGGQKIFTVRSGEPVRIELPPSSGQIGVASSNGASTQIELSQAFAGHTTAVVVKVDRIR